MKAATITPYVAGIVTCISIHAAREGGDAYACVTVHLKRISIHAAREGGDLSASQFCVKRETFQSTPPVKAATLAFCDVGCGQEISIHAAREGGDDVWGQILAKLDISIHAAREGGDVTLPLFIPMPERFQSTPPVKAATVTELRDPRYIKISIHAAREGGDEDGLDTTTISLISIHAAREGGDVAVRMESI